MPPQVFVVKIISTGNGTSIPVVPLRSLCLVPTKQQHRSPLRVENLPRAGHPDRPSQSISKCLFTDQAITCPCGRGNRAGGMVTGDVSAPTEPARATRGHSRARRPVVRVVLRSARCLAEPSHHRTLGATHQGRAELDRERTRRMSPLQLRTRTPVGRWLATRLRGTRPHPTTRRGDRRLRTAHGSDRRTWRTTSRPPLHRESVAPTQEDVTGAVTKTAQTQSSSAKRRDSFVNSAHPRNIATNATNADTPRFCQPAKRPS